MFNIFWIAGENSGDLHAAQVLKEFQKRGIPAKHYGIGGYHMQELGFIPLFPYSRFNVMGFVEVVKHLSFFLSVESKIKDIFTKQKPDLLILVDYPGFNLRIAKMAYNLDIPVLYYICPQFWAWKHKRVYNLANSTNHVACILPFEKELLDIHRINSTYVGHPISEEIAITMPKAQFAKMFSLDITKKWIGFFPGSRDNEIKKLLPTYIKAINNLNSSEYEFLISRAPTINYNLFNEFIESANIKNISVIDRENYAMMKHCDFLTVTSGTATLEAAFIGTPFVLCYKTSNLSYQIGKHFVKIARIGLPNILLNKDLIPELIQEDVNAENLSRIINSYLSNPAKYAFMKKELLEIHNILGTNSASANVVNIAEQLLRDYCSRTDRGDSYH